MAVILKDFACLVAFFVTINAIAAQSSQPRDDNARFLSRGHTYRAVVGDTLLLPCQVHNLGSLVLLWRRGNAVLTAASLMVTRDDRFRLVDGYNLQITNIGPQDAGDYVCQISDRESRDQVHTVEVLVPPSVRPSPSSLHAAARRGGAATLECRAAGNPVPTVHWLKHFNNTNQDQKIAEGQQLVLTNVDRKDSGKYSCTVDNGVAPPTMTTFSLQVLYPPEVYVERAWLHTGEGFTAELLCTVYADPPAEVSWFQNSFPLSATDRLSMTTKDNNHTLTIRNVQPEDFGNYSCSADNSLGRSRRHVEVSGRPGPAMFTSPSVSGRSTSYTLTFTVDSYPPIDELRLLYRQLLINETYQQPARWHDVVLDSTAITAHRDQLTHRGSSIRQAEHAVENKEDETGVSHELVGLQPAAVYEAIVQAKNRYGWNEVSDIYQFHTRGVGADIGPGDSAVASRDLIWGTSTAPQLKELSTTKILASVSSILIVLIVH